MKPYRSGIEQGLYRSSVCPIVVKREIAPRVNECNSEKPHRSDK
jgi:hypothetical protein